MGAICGALIIFYPDQPHTTSILATRQWLWVLPTWSISPAAAHIIKRMCHTKSISVLTTVTKPLSSSTRNLRELYSWWFAFCLCQHYLYHHQPDFSVSLGDNRSINNCNVQNISHAPFSFNTNSVVVCCFLTLFSYWCLTFDSWLGHTWFKEAMVGYIIFFLFLSVFLRCKQFRRVLFTH